MRFRTSRWLALGVVGLGVMLARRALLRWHAAADEVDATLPGDELLPGPNLTATRAITIAAPSGEVWPWIAQMGQGRGGFYTYDGLENLLGLEIHSADHLVDAWQQVEVGDEFRLHPDVALKVVRVEPGRALVVRGSASAGRHPPYDFTWAFVLVGAGSSSRLIVRERYSFSRWWVRVMIEPVAVASFVMSERMLRGIRDRAERVAAGRVPSGNR